MTAASHVCIPPPRQDAQEELKLRRKGTFSKGRRVPSGVGEQGASRESLLRNKMPANQVLLWSTSSHCARVRHSLQASSGLCTIHRRIHRPRAVPKIAAVSGRLAQAGRCCFQGKEGRTLREGLAGPINSRLAADSRRRGQRFFAGTSVPARSTSCRAF